MRSLSSSGRASYAVAHSQEMLEGSVSIEDGSQIGLHASNVNSVAERMQTVGRNIKDASAKVASWMCDHPLETAILAGGAMLASSSVLLGVSFGAKGAACACSAGFSGLSADANSTFAATASPAASSTLSVESTSAFESTQGATSGFVSSPASTFKPCPTPLRVNCEDLNPFSFNVAKGQGFALSESSANTLLLHKAPSTLVHDTEFVVDPKAFCVDGAFSEQVFSFHCDEDGTDYLVTAEDLQNGATVLHTGACAVKPNRSIRYFSNCKKSDSNQQFDCIDNAERACQQVQDFKLTLPPLSKNVGSVFVTEKGKGGKDEYRLFFTNHDRVKSKDLNVDVTTDCQKMLDVPLEFECSGINPSAKASFTLRQNLTATDGKLANFDAGACAFKAAAFQAASHEEKSCNIAFNARSECGGMLNISPTCDDKMIMLISKPPTSGRYHLHALAPDGSAHNLEYVNYYDEPFMILSEAGVSSYDGCHTIRRKIKPGFSLKLDVNHGNLLYEFETAIEAVPKVYRSVELKPGFITFRDDTAIPKGFERACERIDVEHPLCEQVFK